MTQLSRRGLLAALGTLAAAPAAAQVSSIVAPAKKPKPLTIPTVDVVLSPHLSNLYTNPLTALSTDTQRAVLLSSAGEKLPVDFPADVGPQVSDYMTGMLERVLARSLVSTPAGGETQFPVNLILTQDAGNSVIATISSAQWGRDGNWPTSNGPDKFLTVEVAGKYPVRVGNTGLEPLVSVGLQRVDAASDVFASTHNRAMIYRLAAQKGADPKLYTAATNYEFVAGTVAGAGIPQTGLSEPAPGLTAGDHSVLELLANVTRFKQMVPGTSKFVDSYATLARLPIENQYRMTVFGIEWKGTGNAKKPTFYDSRVVFDFDVSWDSDGNLGNVRIDPKPDLSRGPLQVALLVAPFYHVNGGTQWNPSTQGLAHAFYDPAGAFTSFDTASLPQVVSKAHPRYAKIPFR
jgi:hypothetical protein